MSAKRSASLLLAGLTFAAAATTLTPLDAQARRMYQQTTQIAPGLTLTQISDPAPNRIRILTIDPTSGVTIDMAGAGSLPQLKTTSQMAMSENALAAVNGDFGAFEGRPLHAFAVDGTLDQTGFQHGASFAVSYNQTGEYIEPAHVVVGAKPLPAGTHFTITNWNQGDPRNGSIVAFTPYGGGQQHASNGDCTVLIKKSSKYRWMTNQQGLARNYKVMAKRCGSSPLHYTKKSKVILESGTSGAGSNTLRGLKLGSAVRVSWRMMATPQPGLTETPPAGVMEMMGGMPVLLNNGVVEAKSCSSYFCDLNPRTGIGYTATGQILLVTVDGRENGSIGMTLVGFADYMKSLGCTYAVNMDGGGSTTMWVKGQGIVNVPSDSTGERAIPNALLVLDGADPNQPTPLQSLAGSAYPAESQALSQSLEMTDPGSTGGLMDAMASGAFGSRVRLSAPYMRIVRAFQAGPFAQANPGNG
jgi:Phosphodiester glycosidase